MCCTLRDIVFQTELTFYITESHGENSNFFGSEVTL